LILKNFQDLNNTLNMIGRIWHGWTTLENADEYENLLLNEVIPDIEAKNIAGYRGFQLLRRPLENEVEFITLLQFDSWGAVKEFASDDYTQSYIPGKARQVLKRFDDHAQHYEIREQREYG